MTLQEFYSLEPLEETSIDHFVLDPLTEGTGRLLVWEMEGAEISCYEAAHGYIDRLLENVRKISPGISLDEDDVRRSFSEAYYQDESVLIDETGVSIVSRIVEGHEPDEDDDLR